MTPEPIVQPTEDDIRQARQMANHYRDRGYNVLPSSHEEKRPLIRYRDFWEKPVPAATFDRFATPNIQLMTGVAWGLLVIDLDGPDAADWFFGQNQNIPITWKVVSGGAGMHLWFRIPKDHKPIGKAILWQGEEKHSAVERLCDRSLIMAPPSLHPKTGKRYRFVDKNEIPGGDAIACPVPGVDTILAPDPIRADRSASGNVTTPGTTRDRAIPLPGCAGFDPRQSILGVVLGVEVGGIRGRKDPVPGDRKGRPKPVSGILSHDGEVLGSLARSLQGDQFV